jgi:hypothetical protein
LRKTFLGLRLKEVVKNPWNVTEKISVYAASFSNLEISFSKLPSVIESTSIMRGISRNNQLLISNSARKITPPKLDNCQTAFSGMRALDLPVRSHTISPLK